MKKRQLCLMLAMWGAFAACDNEENTPSPVGLASDVIIQGVHESGLLVGTEDISVTLSGDKGIAKVDFYLGAQLVGSDESSPFELQLATAAYADGPYQLKAVVKDGAGKVQEGIKAVKISNVLMQLPALEFNTYVTDQSYHLVIATETGDIIKKQTITTAEPVSITAPADFYSPDYVFYLLKKYNSNGTVYISGTASAQVPRGYELKARIYEEPVTVGSAQLTINNGVAAEVHFGSQHYIPSQTLATGTTTFTIDLSEVKQDVLLRVFPSDVSTHSPKGFLLKDLQPGGSYTLDYANFEDATAQLSFTMPEHTDKEISIQLQPGSDDARTIPGMGFSLVSENTYSYPVFSGTYKYYLDTYFRYPLKASDTHYQKGGGLQEVTNDFVLKPMAANVSITEEGVRKITYNVSTTAETDVFTLVFTSSTWNTNVLVNTGKVTGDFTLIDLRLVIEGLADASLPVYYGYRITDMKLGGYQNFINSKYVTMVDDEPDGPYSVLFAWKASSSSGGRITKNTSGNKFSFR